MWDKTCLEGSTIFNAFYALLLTVHDRRLAKFGNLLWDQLSENPEISREV